MYRLAWWGSFQAVDVSNAVWRGGDTMHLERGLSFRSGELVQLAIDFSPLVIKVELLLPFSFVWGG